jgi:isoquinoline 1-oxidoreductase beta subunit
MKNINLSRRNFLRSTGIVGGGLVIGFSLNGCSTDILPIDSIAGAFSPNAFIQVTPQNNIRFYCPRDEMGQGITTGLGTLIGEDLDVNPADLDIAFAGVHSDYNNPAMGVQATGGSSSLRAHYFQLRQTAANVRQIIIEAAARDLGVEPAEITTQNAHVIVAGKHHPYGDFVTTAAMLKLETEAPLKPNAEFNYIGKQNPRLDAIGKSTGTTQYGIDVDIPGLHHAVVLRSPVVGAKLLSVDSSTAKNMPGVTDVIEISSGVAVVAERYWQAKTAAAALSLKWEKIPQQSLTTEKIRADYQQAMQDDEGLADMERGDLASSFADATEIIESEYWAPFLAHAPMEPMNAVLRIEDGKAEIWSGVQGIIGAEGLVSRFSGIDAENITAHNTYHGGSFGRRGTLTHIVEVTEIVVATNKPVKLLWSREDDIKNGFYRPASLMKIKAAIDDQGIVSSWDAKRVGGNITPETLKNMLPAILPGMPNFPIDTLVGITKDVFSSWFIDPSSTEGLGDDYDFPNRVVRHVTQEHGVPLTFWRSVGHSYTAFAKETMMDELAHKAKLDPVEFRLRNSTDKPRLNNVIKVAGEYMQTAGLAPGHHLGFAAHSSFMTDVAQVAEVSIENNQIRVHKVTCVVDCGVAVNPDVIRAQMEGSVMYGLTAALYGDMNIKDGEFMESNFHNYPILRMNEAPAVEVVIIDSIEDPTGVGEPGLPPIAPAVANAVFAATGARLRSLPLKLA